MKQIKAIQTKYKGYHFRSRLEARFAIMFDMLGIDWDYEVEGFELPSGWYLPDFFVRYPEESPQARMHPGAGYWVEIKGEKPTKKEQALAAELAASTNHKAWIFYNGIGTHGRAFEASQAPLDIDSLPVPAQELLALGKRLIREQEAGEVVNSAPIYCCMKAQDESSLDYIYAALEVARAARFEHGDKPNV